MHNKAIWAWTLFCLVVLATTCHGRWAEDNLDQSTSMEKQRHFSNAFGVNRRHARSTEDKDPACNTRLGACCLVIKAFNNSNIKADIIKNIANTSNIEAHDIIKNNTINAIKADIIKLANKAINNIKAINKLNKLNKTINNKLNKLNKSINIDIDIDIDINININDGVPNITNITERILDDLDLLERNASLDLLDDLDLLQSTKIDAITGGARIYEDSSIDIEIKRTVDDDDFGFNITTDGGSDNGARILGDSIIITDDDGSRIGITDFDDGSRIDGFLDAILAKVGKVGKVDMRDICIRDKESIDLEKQIKDLEKQIKVWKDLEKEIRDLEKEFREGVRDLVIQLSSEFNGLLKEWYGVISGISMCKLYVSESKINCTLC